MTFLFCLASDIYKNIPYDILSGLNSGLNNDTEKYVRNFFNYNYDYLTLHPPDEIILFEGFLRPFLESMAMDINNLHGQNIDEYSAGAGAYTDNFVNTCSFCGNVPSFGFLKSDDETQNYLMLECSRCGNAWRYYRVQCVFCGEEDPSKLEIFKSDEYGNAGLQYCKTCGNYLKIIDLRNNQALIPEIEDILAIPLDIWIHKYAFRNFRKHVFVISPKAAKPSLSYYFPMQNSLKSLPSISSFVTPPIILSR